MLSYIADTCARNIVGILGVRPIPEDYIKAYELGFPYDNYESIVDILSHVPVSEFDVDIVGRIMRVSSIYRNIILSRISDHRLSTVLRYLYIAFQAYPQTMAYCVGRLHSIIDEDKVPRTVYYASIFGWDITSISNDYIPLADEPVDIEYCVSLLTTDDLDTSVRIIIRLSKDLLVSQSLIDWIEQYAVHLIPTQPLYTLVNKGIRKGINFEKCYNITDNISDISAHTLLSLINGTSTINDVLKLDPIEIDSLVDYVTTLTEVPCESTRYHVLNIINSV